MAPRRPKTENTGFGGCFKKGRGVEETVYEFLGTGLFTLIGGPVVFLWCVRNYFLSRPQKGKRRRRKVISLYWFVPVLQAEIVVLFAIAFWGTRLTWSFSETLLYLYLSTALATCVVCLTIQALARYPKLQLTVPYSPRFFAILLSGVGCPVAWGTLSAYGFSTSGPCSTGRCRSARLLFGQHDYIGSLSFPAICLGVGLTLVYVFVFRSTPLPKDHVDSA